ncbi:MAG: hypothetical protein U0359_20025 [Byssovorax sp.]
MEAHPLRASAPGGRRPSHEDRTILLAAFSCTSGEDTVMTATAVSLKKLALDPTPPPPAAALAQPLAGPLPGLDRVLPSVSPPPAEAQFR